MFPISWFLAFCSLLSSYELVPIYVEAKKLSQASCSMYSFVTLINLIDVCSSTKISASRSISRNSMKSLLKLTYMQQYDNLSLFFESLRKALNHWRKEKRLHLLYLVWHVFYQRIVKRIFKAVGSCIVEKNRLSMERRSDRWETFGKPPRRGGWSVFSRSNSPFDSETGTILRLVPLTIRSSE